MGTKYKLTFINNSTMNDSICVYQKYPEDDKNVYSLAWFSEECAAEGRTSFDWSVDYTLEYAKVGVVAPGVNFKTSLAKSADPGDKKINSTVLTREGNLYKLEYGGQTSPGSLGIHCDDTIPNDTVSIGVGMGGKTIFATLARSNIDFTFTPHPRYYVAYGRYTEGYIIDVNKTTKSHEIIFPSNKFHAVATLKEDNTWSIEYK